MRPSFKRIFLPVEGGGAQPHLLRVATVFSSWFDAPLQLVCHDEAILAELQALAVGLGVPIEPVLYFEDQQFEDQQFEDQKFEDQATAGLVAYAHSQAPSIIIADPAAGGRELAATSSQPVFLSADDRRRRMPVGPLMVEITGRPDDESALALAAVLAKAIGESIRLVADDEDEAGSAAACQAEARLRQMGCEVGVDRPEPTDRHPLILVGRTRGATAVVVPAGRITDGDLLETAVEAGVDVFVAPTPDPEAGRAEPGLVDLDRALDRAPVGARLELLDRGECLARLDRHSVARIGYVDAGWPTVVPVNYRLHKGDIFIRSLAGAKLRAAERGDTICLELDGYDEALRTGWSVVAHGLLEVISDPTVLSEAWANDPQPWVASDDWQWLRMVPISLTGREVWPAAGS